MHRASLNLVLGTVFWLALAGLGVSLARSVVQDPGKAAPLTEQLTEFAIQEQRRVDLTLPGVGARFGDPIFTTDEDGDWVQAGYLIDVDDRRRATRATAIWYTPARQPEDCSLSYHRSRGSLGEVVETLLPADKRAALVARLAEANRLYGPELVAAFRPIVERTIQESAPVIEQAVRDSIANHRPQLEALGLRYEETFIRQRLVPLVREEVLPIVRLHGEPVAREIGNEIWDRASVWRFGWRALYDKSPLPDRNLTEKEFDRFLEREAIPVVEAHVDDMVEAAKRILTDVTQSGPVRDELGSLAKDLVADDELQALLKSIVQESVVDNQALRDVMVRNWRDAEAKRAIDLAGDRLEPVVRQLGDEIFGTRETGIDPNFARVLRNQILGKDRRWFVATPGEAPASQPFEVLQAPRGGVYPLVILAVEDSQSRGVAE